MYIFAISKSILSYIFKILSSWYLALLFYRKIMENCPSRIPENFEVGLCFENIKIKKPYCGKIGDSKILFRFQKE